MNCLETFELAVSIMEGSDTFIDGHTAYWLARRKLDFPLLVLDNAPDESSLNIDDIDNRVVAVEGEGV